MKEYDIKQRTFNFALETLKSCKKVAENHREFVLTKTVDKIINFNWSKYARSKKRN